MSVTRTQEAGKEAPAFCMKESGGKKNMAKKKEMVPRVRYNGSSWELKAIAGRTLKIEKDDRTIHIIDTAARATNQAARAMMAKK